MITTVRYVLLTALRDWLFAGIFLALVCAFFFSYFLGSTVIIEKNEMISTFSSASIRNVLIVGMTIFICFNIRRAFENKEIDLMLSRPVSRHQFIFSYWLGFSVVAILMISFFSILIGFFSTFDKLGLSIWTICVTLETLIVIAFAIFSSVLLSSAVTSVLLTFGFYIVARTIGFFSYVILKHPAQEYWSFEYVSQKIIWVISYIMPRLDLFSQSKWLVHGVDFSTTNIFTLFIQTVIYVPLLLILTAIDFKRKQF